MSEDLPWVNGLTDEEVEQLRQQKYKLSQYGKQKLKKLMMNQEPYPDEMFQEAERREAKNKTLVVKVSEEDYQKVQEELERQKLANKTFEELTKEEKIKLALEELAAIVMGGQDGEEFYNSVKFIKNVLESLKDT